MSSKDVDRIIIRHMSGSKANQIEQLPLGELRELTIGRDPSSKISFDPGDDVVSRNHAVIRVVGDDQISFKIADLGSSNGTFLNNERIKGETELLPEDMVELGKNGPKFVFDVQPRPTNLAARTRIISLDNSTATRVIKTAEIAAATATVDVGKTTAFGANTTQVGAEGGKVAIGKETVLHMLGEQRRSASRVWIASVAGIAAFVLLGGGALYWKHQQDLAAQQADLMRVQQEAAAQQANLEAKTRQLQSEASASFSQRIGMDPQEITRQFGNAVAKVDLQWRIYDQQTGEPVFHKTVIWKKDGRLLPAYVHFPSGLVLRWLTLANDGRSNLAISGNGSATAFVVSDAGFMLTSKHVAAGWTLAYGVAKDTRGNDYQEGVLYEWNSNPERRGREPEPKLINLSDYPDLNTWVPETGGFIFETDKPSIDGPGNVPDPSKDDKDKRFFEGRDDRLEVSFPGSRVAINATLGRTSSESDAALIKIDTPQALTKVELATGDDIVTPGERVMALGYPQLAIETLAVSDTIEGGQPRQLINRVPEVSVTEGIVSKVTPSVKEENGVTLRGLLGDVIQLSINSAGQGNSGGPVFNSEGKVIGLFTYVISGGSATDSGAVPIKYGLELMQPQRN
jgi:serine protease Do